MKFNEALAPRDNRAINFVSIDKILISHRYLSTGFRIHIYNWIASQRASRGSIRLASEKYTKRTVGSIIATKLALRTSRDHSSGDYSSGHSRVIVPCFNHVISLCSPSRAEIPKPFRIRVACAVRVCPGVPRSAIRQRSIYPIYREADSVRARTVEFGGLTPSNRKRTIILSSSRINEAEHRRYRQPVARRTPMKMLQSLNALAGKISPGSPTDSNANKVHMHNNNNNNNNVVHHHPYSKQAQPSPSHSANGDQKENT